MEIDIKKILGAMTTEDKAAICSGQDFFTTKALEEYDIPSILLSDGPHGLRKQSENADFLGINESIKSTCFPTEATLACSFDRELIHEVGAALGAECQAEGVGVLLGPAVNIKRSPLCGRNFEYFSEDPYLTSELATAYIEGLQSQGVGACIKHFAANNQEDFRLSVDVKIDERTLREIYLSSFEKPVKEARPWSVMCAYNKLNGVYCSENKILLTDILRQQWGFEGFVVSDWGAVAHRVEGIMAGLNLEMPPSGKLNDAKILKALDSGELDPVLLDKSVEELLKIVFKSAENRKTGIAADLEKHHELAKRAASESMVLLKNEDSILPLDNKRSIAVIGEMAMSPRFQGAGSSHVNPAYRENIYKMMLEKSADLSFSAGYKINSDLTDDSLLQKAVSTAEAAETAVIFAGLIEEYESEGYDRSHMRLPDSHIELIEAVSAVQPNTVVVLANGAPVEMPWAARVKGLLEGYLGGQALGGAIADILFGDVNPCGKLAETFPEKLSHNPSYCNFPGSGKTVEYREGLFIGYRYYDKKGIKPLWPFGYGLSYTSFEYSSLELDKNQMTDKDFLSLSFKVKNTGTVQGKEIVQLYVGKNSARIIRAPRELKGFQKISLKPGEQKTVRFKLEKRAFAYYDEELSDWSVEGGEYQIMAASSSADIRLTGTVQIKNTERKKTAYTRFSTIGEIMDDPEQQTVLAELIDYLSVEGALLYNTSDNKKMGDGMVRGMPLCTLYSYSNACFDEEKLQYILKQLNKTSREN